MQVETNENIWIKKKSTIDCIWAEKYKENDGLSIFLASTCWSSWGVVPVAVFI